MRIQHNIMAMNAYRNYNTNTSALSKNLEKLSSGYKINRAGDDAAGLAISEKMRAQITGLNAAQKNVKDGISLVKTAEGAMQEIQDMLNRMDYLATQSANGTYDDPVDRKNLQKEVDALRSEINRIADSSNFNGIKLLDGSMSKAEGVTIGDVTTNTAAQAELSPEMGSLAATEATGKVDGERIQGTPEQKSQISVYVGDITNNNAAAKKITFNYKDNNGASKKVELEVAAGKSVTTEDIAKALKGETVTNITRTDDGTAISATDNGLFTDLYTVESKGNIITITAKNANGATVNGGTIDSTKADATGLTVTNNFDTADVTAAEEKLKQDYNGSTTDTSIAYGSKAGTPTPYAAKTADYYKVASQKLTISKGAADLHNAAITVGDKTYVIQKGTDELKGVPSGATIVKVTDNAAAADIAGALAQAITREEGTNGSYVATVAGGVLNVMESTNKAKEHYDAGTEGKADDVIKLTTLTKTAAGTNTYNASVTVDASKVTNGTTITLNGKSYVLTNDKNLDTPSSATQVLFNPGASSNDIANALANAVKANLSKTGANSRMEVVVDEGKVTVKNSTEVASGFGANGSGLKLQIGDTSDAFNQLSVAVKDMHTNAMKDTNGNSIATIDISNQPGASAAVDVIKNAINYVSEVRGDLGAIQNRLDHTKNNLSVMAENIQDAESTIRDTDVAEEMMAYTKNNILIQSAQAMLAQANAVPQGVLQLLG